MSIRATAIAFVAITATLSPRASLLWADENQEAPTRDEQGEQIEQGKQEELVSSGLPGLPPPPRFTKLPKGTPTPIARSPSTVTVIDGTELRSMGIRFLSDALRRVPGLEVMRTTSTESNVNARGYNDAPATAQGMMALLDGRQVYNEFFGNVLWDFVPVSIEEIDRIEVIRGPGSFLYGPNAMHGLVNIVTKSPLEYDKDVLHLSSSYGSFDSSVASLTYVKREEDSGFKATLGWDDIRQFQESTPSKNVGDTKFMEFRFEKELGLLTAEDHLELTAGIIEQKQELLIPSTLAIPPDQLSNNLQESFVKANYTVENLKAQVYWTGFDATSVPDQVFTPFTLDLDTVDIDLQYTVDLENKGSVTADRARGGHTLTMGTGYRHATFKTKDQDVADGRHSTDLAWVFVQDEFKLGDDVFVTAGVRLDWHSISDTNVSPRIAAVWRFDEVKNGKDEIVREQYLRASLGFGFRNPSLRELWFDMPLQIAPVTISGNTDLKAEEIRSFELGYFGSPVDRLNAGVNVYYNLINDLIVFQQVSATEAKPFNQDNEEAYGVEAEVDYRFSEWVSGFANYSYGNRRNRDTNARVLAAPQNKANAGIRFSRPLGFDSGKRISGMFWVNYFDETTFGGVPVSVGDYALLNGQISYDFPEGRVYLGAFNLLDNDHLEHPEAQRYGLIVKAGFSLIW